MAGKVKGITIEIGGDTTGLTKALSNVNKETNSIQRELREVEKSLKLDPKNTELLAQKQKLLSKEIGTVETKVSALKSAKEKADADMANGTEVNQEEYRKLVREITNTENQLKTLNAKVDENKVKFDALGESAGKVNNFMKNAGIAALGAGTGIVAMGLNAAAAADDINTLATQTGLSTDQIQIFQYASDRIDVSLETLTGSMAKLTKNMYSAQQGSKNQKAAFDALGIAITDNDGKLRNNQDVMNDAINALSKMENETQRDAYAMQIFGKSAQDLNPLILGGADALNKMAEEARASGIILDEETLQSANKLNDAVDNLKATATGAFSKIGAEIAEGLTPYIEPLAEMIAEFGNFIVENQDGIVTALGAIGTALLTFNIVTTMQGVIQKFLEMKKATEGLTTAQAALNLIMSANPIALIAAAIAGLVAAFVILWNKSEDFRNFWIGLWEGIKSACSAAWEAIKGFFNSAWEGVKSIWSKAKEFFNNIWVNIKNAFHVDEFFNIGKNLLEGLWNGISDKVQWLKEQVSGVVNKIKSWFTGKEGFDEHSPSKWAYKVGDFVDEGLANGVFENIDKVKKSFKELFNAVEEEHEDLTNEEKKYNEELERIRTEGSEKANKAYLDGLKDTAEKAKEQRENVRKAYEDMVDDVKKNIESLQNEMDRYKKGLSDVDLVNEVTTTFVGLESGDESYTRYALADLSAKKKELEEFRDRILRLNEIGIDEDMIEQIKSLGGEEGGYLAQALLEATPEQRKTFINDFKAIGELSGEATSELFKSEIETAAEDAKNLLAELSPDLLNVGQTWGTYLGQGIMEKLREVLTSLKASVDVEGYGAKTIVVSTQINQDITATPQTAYETAEQTRRTMENLLGQAVLA